MAVERKEQAALVEDSDACPSHWFTELVKATKRVDSRRAGECALQLRKLGWSVLYTGRRSKRGGV